MYLGSTWMILDVYTPFFFLFLFSLFCFLGLFIVRDIPCLAFWLSGFVCTPLLDSMHICLISIVGFLCECVYGMGLG